MRLKVVYVQADDLPVDENDRIYNVIFQGTDKTLQKKAYRFLDNICSMKTSTCTEFVSENIEQLQTVLLKNLASSNSSSKGVCVRVTLVLVVGLHRSPCIYTAFISDSMYVNKDKAPMFCYFACQHTTNELYKSLLLP